MQDPYASILQDEDILILDCQKSLGADQLVIVAGMKNNLKAELALPALSLVSHSK